MNETRISVKMILMCASRQFGEPTSLGTLRQNIQSERSAARKHVRVRILGRAIANAIDEITDPVARERLLDEIRSLRRLLIEDPDLAQSHIMTLANACAEAITDDVVERNRQYLAELQTVLSSVNWKDRDISGFDIYILGLLYLGLLQRQRYEDADNQLTEMSKLAFGGTARERLEWLIAVRHGFWILRDHRQFGRLDTQLDLVRDFRRRHPGDDHEAPHALLAMLFGAFESAERRSDCRVADLRFDEACSLIPPVRDWYGHVQRLERELLNGQWPDAARALGFAKRLRELSSLC